jgi:hypothetical protein
MVNNFSTSVMTEYRIPYGPIISMILGRYIFVVICKIAPGQMFPDFR